MKVTRRKFISASTAVGLLTVLPKGQAVASVRPDSYATLIDLNKCNGCAGLETPLCVSSCRSGRQSSFPDPPKSELRDYWPQKRHEDWSKKKQVTDKFTPYNWIFVQQVKVGDKTLSIPRRCMHCDNPACVKLCPFGVNHKTSEGPVYIDTNLCFGGAKCRTVCPWRVPQRQAGVGLYTLWQKYLPVGGGVMFKCDLCRDRLKTGDTPYCIESCPQKAMEIGRREDIYARAQALKEQYNGDIYGMGENGGTSTIYVSPVKFSDIDQALVEQAEKDKSKNPVRLNQPANMLDKQRNWAWLGLASPVVGAVAAMALSGKAEEKK